MTYPSYRARRDTSIHLFRHLTCLERETKEERRGEELASKKASLLALRLQPHCVDIHDNVPIGQTHYFTPFHPFMISYAHMFTNTNAQRESQSMLELRWRQIYDKISHAHSDTRIRQINY